VLQVARSLEHRHGFIRIDDGRRRSHHRAKSGVEFLSTQIRKGISMNKNDLIAAVTESSGLNKADAAKAVESTLDVITSALRDGDEVRIVGFGTFAVATRAASDGRNPRTGETIKIPASKRPKFTAGKGLKDAVNG
jgi:DNA-binding protein HU-beta